MRCSHGNALRNPDGPCGIDPVAEMWSCDFCYDHDVVWFLNNSSSVRWFGHFSPPCCQGIPRSRRLTRAVAEQGSFIRPIENLNWTGLAKAVKLPATDNTGVLPDP